MPTISKENYLKAIYQSIALGETATTSKLSRELNVSDAAISDMAKKLSKEGLISYEKYKGVVLTKEGQKIALKVIRRHRLWELFLTKVLGIPWGEVHNEAERLEHHSSEELINKIDEYLGYPTFDPHGDPIPKSNGDLPSMPKFFPLTKTKVGTTYKVVRVDDKNTELIKYFSKIGLAINGKIKILERLSFDNSINIEMNNKFFTFSEKVASSIYVNEFINEKEK
ncbi:metal-dependent transcriptional regulator [Melioribacteraceae bacterium 4301-Me]|uniref:metal-dependent transcriptional regulator n=1 Tax=Pyranulibacter aquaticus TaxID=3163344 RepID=UPI00359B81F8